MKIKDPKSIQENLCMYDIDSKRVSNINTSLSVGNIDINHSLLDIKTCIFPSPQKLRYLFIFV